MGVEGCDEKSSNVQQGKERAAEQSKRDGIYIYVVYIIWMEIYRVVVFPNIFVTKDGLVCVGGWVVKREEQGNGV